MQYKFYYRIDSKGNPIPGSNIRAKKKPRSQRYVELVPTKYYDCCNIDYNYIITAGNRKPKYFVKLDDKNLPINGTLIKSGRAPSYNYQIVYNACCTCNEDYPEIISDIPFNTVSGIIIGDEVTISLTTTAKNYTVKWYMDIEGENTLLENKEYSDGTIVSGVNTLTLKFDNISEEFANGVFTIEVTNCNNHDTYYVYTTTDVLPEIDEDPQNRQVDVGDSAEFTVSATGENMVYFWFYINPWGDKIYFSEDGETSIYGYCDGWDSAIVTTSGYGTSNFTIISNSHNIPLSIGVTVGNLAGEIDSELATLTYTGAPLITSMPTEQDVILNQSTGNGSVSVTATGTDLVYNWVYWNDVLNQWEPIENDMEGTLFTGINTNTLTVENWPFDGIFYIFKLIITSDNGEGETADSLCYSFIREYSEGMPYITVQPEDVYDDSVEGLGSFSVEVESDTPVTYQWQASYDNGDNWYDLGEGCATGVTTNTIETHEGECNNYAMYRVVITNDVGTIYSDVANLINTSIVIDEHPQDQSIGEGDIVTFSVNATSYELSYSWQFLNPEGEVWTDIPDGDWNGVTVTGNNSASMTLSGLSEGWLGSEVRVIISNFYNEVTSNSAQIIE